MHAPTEAQRGRDDIDALVHPVFAYDLRPENAAAVQREEQLDREGRGTRVVGGMKIPTDLAIKAPKQIVKKLHEELEGTV